MKQIFRQVCSVCFVVLMTTILATPAVADEPAKNVEAFLGEMDKRINTVWDSEGASKAKRLDALKELRRDYHDANDLIKKVKADEALTRELTDKIAMVENTYKDPDMRNEFKGDFDFDLTVKEQTPKRKGTGKPGSDTTIQSGDPCPGLPIPDYAGSEGLRVLSTELKKARDALSAHLSKEPETKTAEQIVGEWTKWNSERKRLFAEMNQAQVRLAWEAADPIDTKSLTKMMGQSFNIQKDMMERFGLSDEIFELQKKYDECIEQVSKMKDKFHEHGKVEPGAGLIWWMSNDLEIKIRENWKKQGSIDKEILKKLNVLDKGMRSMFDERMADGVKNINKQLAKEGRKADFDLYKPRTGVEKKNLDKAITSWLRDKLRIPDTVPESTGLGLINNKLFKEYGANSKKGDKKDPCEREESSSGAWVKPVFMGTAVLAAAAGAAYLISEDDGESGSSGSSSGTETKGALSQEFICWGVRHGSSNSTINLLFRFSLPGETEWSIVINGPGGFRKGNNRIYPQVVSIQYKPESPGTAPINGNRR